MFENNNNYNKEYTVVVLKLFDSRAGRAISMPYAKIPILISLFILPLQYTLGHITQSVHFTADFSTVKITALTEHRFCALFTISLNWTLNLALLHGKNIVILPKHWLSPLINGFFKHCKCKLYMQQSGSNWQHSDPMAGSRSISVVHLVLFGPSSQKHQTS